MSNAFIIAAIVLPALILLVLRSNAAITFLSLCLGSVLAQVAATDTSQVLGAVVRTPTGNFKTISLVLLLAPPLLTALFMSRSTRPGHLFLQIVPALGVGAAGLILSQPFLPPAAMKQLLQSSLWARIDSLAVIIIGLSALASLLVVWVQRTRPNSQHNSHHGGH